MVRKRVSSRCAHAQALRLAFHSLAVLVGQPSLQSILNAHPQLVSTTEVAGSAPQVEMVGKRRGGRDAWAVRTMGTWSALVQPVKSAYSQAPRCQNILCASRRPCIHVIACYADKEAEESQEDYSGESDAEGILLPSRDDAHDDGIPPAELDENESIRRRSRNMLPCAAEVRSGLIFDSYGKQGRGSPTGMGVLPTILHERTCVKCRRKRNGRVLTTTEAVLHTMGGRVAVRTGTWTCSERSWWDTTGPTRPCLRPPRRRSSRACTWTWC